MRVIGLVLLLVYGVAVGQKEPVAADPVGSVTGHVVFAETRQPARLVQVLLLRKPTQAEIDADPYAQTASNGGPPKVVTLEARTQLDGSFVITEVPVGEYYVLAKLAGYVLPVQNVLNEQQEKDLAYVMRELPVARVGAARASDVNVELHRGGTISGRVQFEDGSPVVGMWVQAMPEATGDRMFGLRPQYLLQAVGYVKNQVVTDDDGRYRIVGLQPGKYLLVTNVATSGGPRMVTDGGRFSYTGGAQSTTYLTVYQPAAFHKKDANVFEIKGTEVDADARIELRLSALHVVRGRVFAREDRHPPNLAYVQLKDESDSGFYRFGQVQADGSYEIPNVPAGSYTLLVSNARDVSPAYNGRQRKPEDTLRSYAEAKEAVVVVDGDVSATELLLDEVKK